MPTQNTEDIVSAKTYAGNTTKETSVSGYPSDSLMALLPYGSRDDFTGRAAIYESANATAPANLDLFVNSVEVPLKEYIQIEKHIGNTLSLHAPGRAPSIISISAELVETRLNFGKQYLLELYQNRLRLEAVARTGVVPVFEFVRAAIEGPFLTMRITDSTSSEDTLLVNMTMLVLRLSFLGDTQSAVIDFQQGEDLAEDTAITTSTENTPADPEVTLEGTDDIINTRRTSAGDGTNGS